MRLLRGNSDLATLLAGPCPAQEPALAWLGQAGFLIRWGDFRLMIDPYLSDSLAKKYAGTQFPHRRMMPPPIRAEAVANLDAVLCTHAHTDHMDPETLGVLAAANPRCRFVVPRAAVHTAADRGAGGNRSIAINAGEEVLLAPGLRLHALASAHEELQTDEQGNHHFLGYVLGFGDTVLYHSGDCVPYPGLAQALAAQKVQWAILPVNGRDPFRREHGILGNFTFAEAVTLCAEAGIGAMIACHFGMFDFNTVDEDWLDRQIADTRAKLHCVRPVPGQVYSLEEVGWAEFYEDMRHWFSETQ